MSIKNKHFILLGFAVIWACLPIFTMAAEDNWQNNSFFHQIGRNGIKSSDDWNKINSEFKAHSGGVQIPPSQFTGNLAPYALTEQKKPSDQPRKEDQAQLERLHAQVREAERARLAREAHLRKTDQDLLERLRAQVMQAEKDRLAREEQQRKAEQDLLERLRAQVMQAEKESLVREEQQKKAEQELLERLRAQVMQAEKESLAREEQHKKAQQDLLEQLRVQQAKDQQEKVQQAAAKIQQEKELTDEKARLKASLAVQQAQEVEKELTPGEKAQQEQNLLKEYKQLASLWGMKQEKKPVEQKVLTSEEKNEKAYNLALDLISNAKGQDEINLTELLSAIIEAELGFDETESAAVAEATILSLRDVIKEQQEYDLQRSLNPSQEESKESKEGKKDEEEENFSVLDGMMIEILNAGREFYLLYGHVMNESEVKNLLLEKFPFFKNLTPAQYDKEFDNICMRMGIC